MGTVAIDNGVETVAKLEGTPQGVVKRWVAELEIARAAEKDWRKVGGDIFQRYSSEKQAENTFNILWSNTETLRPALYNSTPDPDVRRRFRDADPVGRYGSMVLKRALIYSNDADDLDHAIQMTVLDVLLPGRGLARVKYEPKFRDIAGAEDPFGVEPTPQEISDESAPIQHVKWDKFLRGPGETWAEVPWVSFEHRMPKDQLVEMFGEELANKIPLSESETGESSKDKTIRSLVKTGCIFEIWDKAANRVLFICEKYPHKPLLVQPDPLRLGGFFPMPRPIYAIEDSTSLIPQPLYTKYQTQAEELNKVSHRITKVVEALKVRGAYASNLSELAVIIEATDNQMIPIVNASEVAAMGGLDKAIWIMPIDKLSGVLKDLYEARAATLQTLYEITGLGDIMRGVSNPHETLGAQQLKSQWGTLRLQRLQREVQRFIRDLMRLKGELIAEHFQKETLQAMTGVQLPTAEDKQKLQMQAQQAQASGQQIPPEVQAQGERILAMPTWDDVMKLLRSDEIRRFQIDIETDSTVQETLTRDAQGMQEALTGVTNLFTGLGPAIQEGVLTVDVAKQLALSMARSAKMGDAVEDAIEQMQQPPPPPPPPPDKSVEVAQIKAQSDAAIAAAKVKADGEIAQLKEQAEAARLLAEQQHTQQLEGLRGQTEATTAGHESQATQIEAAAKARIAEVQEQSKKDIEALKATAAATLAAAEAKADYAKSQMVATINAESKKDSELIKAAVAMLTAHIAEQGAEKDRAAKAATDGAKNENDKAKIEADKSNAKAASGENDELKTHMKSMLDALVKMQKPRKIKLEMDPKGNVTGATAAHED